MQFLSVQLATLRNMPPPSRVAFSTIHGDQYDEDGWVDGSIILIVDETPVVLREYLLNTEPKQQNVQNLDAGDHLWVRPSDKPLWFEKAGTVLHNTLLRPATPSRPGLHRLLLVVPSEPLKIERNEEMCGRYTHNTILRVVYNVVCHAQGRGVICLS